MQPVYGRFNALHTANGSLIFARLLTPTSLQLVHATTAYTASLSPTAIPPPRIRACKQHLTPDLLALLLALPHTTAALESSSKTLSADTAAPYVVDTLLLRCKDRAGVELEVCLPIVPACAHALLEEVHTSLFAAVVGLEAVVRESAGEKGEFIGEVGTEGVCLESVNNALRPLMIGGESVEQKATFRKASAANAAIQANRAFVIANGAGNVRESLLEQRRIRREAEMEKMRRAREMVNRAKRRVEEGKGRGDGGVGKRSRSLFDSVEEREVKGDAKGEKEQTVNDADKDGDNVKKKEAGDKVDTNAVDRHGSAFEKANVISDPVENEPRIVKEGTAITDDKVVPPQQRPPLKKKRKKRQLV